LSRNVIVLGAGASQSAGAPVMRDFFDAAEELRTNPELNDDRSCFDLVFKALNEFTRATSKANVNTTNIEMVFSAFEIAALSRSLGSLTREEIQELPRAMNRLIVRTLEMCTQFKGSSEMVGVTQPPADYYSFAKSLRDDFNGSYADTTIITFNYDIALDFALSFWGIRPKYHLKTENPLEDRWTRLSLLKLHGSLNWGECTDKCSDVDSVVIDPNQIGSYPGHTTYIPVTKYLDKHTCKCGKRLQSVIVPPTTNKMQHYKRLESVWTEAIRSLKTAENIFVVGYSLPETDRFFRDLYSVGTISETRMKKFWVFDPEPTVEGRFRDLLGPDASGRFEFSPSKFASATGKIRAAWKRATGASN